MNRSVGDGPSFSPLAGATVSVALAGFVLLLLGLAADVMTPVLFAFFLAALALPAYRGLQKRGVKPGMALLLLFVFLVLGGILLALLVLTSVGHLQSGLSAYSEQLAAQLAGIEAALVERGIGSAGASEQAGATAGSLLGALLRMIADAASTVVVSLMIVIFFLLESERVMGIMRSEAVQQRPLLRHVPEVAHTAAVYFGIRTRLNVLTGLGVSAICWVIGIDYPLLWGVLAFLLSYIPYIGLFTAMIPPTLLALAEFGWPQALLVVIGITAINFGIENVVEPGYTGKRLKLSPTVVFLSFFFWAWLLGPVGALLSMPITVLLMLVFQREEGTRWLAEIMGRAD